MRVFLVAEHSALRKSIEILLADEGLEVCSWAAHGVSALGELCLKSDVVVVSLSGGGEGGLDLVREIGARPGSPPRIVLSPDDDIQSIRRAFAAGARGYVTNRDAPEALADAVREVYAGRVYEPRLRVNHD